MKCPYCNKRYFPLSATLNSFNNKRCCNNCGEEFSIYLNVRKVLIGILPALLLTFLLVSPVLSSFGVNSGAGALMGVVLMLFSLDMKSIK